MVCCGNSLLLFPVVLLIATSAGEASTAATSTGRLVTIFKFILIEFRRCIVKRYILVKIMLAMKYG